MNTSLAGLARYRQVGDNESELLAALESARVVNVLDACGESWRCVPRIDGVTECHVGLVNPAVFLGRSPDDARAKAAAWVAKQSAR